MQSADERLDGWKRIAQHLNRDVRTLRRWELNEGLPVHRLMHDKQGTVYAFRSELDTWRAQRGGAPVTPTKHKKTRLPGKPGPRWLWLVVPALLIGTALMWYQPAEKKPTIAFGEWDWVLITQFDNRTGAELLDGTLEYALQRELANSAFVKVAPRERINDALALMKLPSSTEIDIKTGREISLRDGGIRMLVTGRIEKLGNSYLLSTDLVNPADGVTLASFSADASGQDQILTQIRSLSQEVRIALGEALSAIEASEEMLAKVTTPSLEALQLFSEANRMMTGPDRFRAIPVLEQAVRVDPDFASAHLLLTYAYRDRDQVEKAREHLQKAVVLAEQASERERLFILATYYRYLGEPEKEIETYHLLLRLYPDHFWASGNLSNIYESLGRLDQAYKFRVHATELRPNQASSMMGTAELAMANGDHELARSYIEKARLFEENVPYTNARLILTPVFHSWVEGDYQLAARELDRFINSKTPEELLAKEWEFVHVRSILMALGKLDRFREISAMRSELGWFQALVDFDSGTNDTMNEFLRSATAGFWVATLMAQNGQLEKASEMIEDPRSIQNLPPPFAYRDWKNLARGQLALAEGRLQDAVSLLSTDTMILNISAKYPHLFAMHSLAQAYERLGEPAQSIETLETASLQKPLTIYYTAGTWMWLRNQYYLQQLYTKTGQPEAAARVQDELREVLQLADSGHPFLQYAK